MKLENVEYRYRRDLDRWLIIFPTHAEAKAFEGYYSDGKYKPNLSTYSKTTTETTRYRAIYAKLIGRFEQLRQLYKAKHMHDTIVDDLESDGTFDKIYLIFDNESGIASFRIEKFETWTDWACKSILNTQYGVDAGPSKRVAVTRYELGNYSGSIDYIELGPWNGCDITTVHFSSRTMFWIDNKPYRFYDAMKIFGNIGPHDILDVVPEYYEEPDTDELGIPCCKAIRITLKPSCVTVAAKVLEEIKPLSSDVGQGGLCVRRIKARHDGTFEDMCDAESIDVEICDVDLVSVDICDYPAPSAAICVTHKDPCTHIYTKFYIFSETNTFINNREVCYSIFEKFMQYHEEEPCIDEIDIKLVTDSDYSYDEDFERCNICDKVFVTVEENYIPKEVKDYMEDMKRRIVHYKNWKLRNGK